MAGLVLLFVVLLWQGTRKPAEDLRAAREVLKRFRRPRPKPPEEWTVEDVRARLVDLRTFKASPRAEGPGASAPPEGPSHR